MHFTQLNTSSPRRSRAFLHKGDEMMRERNSGEGKSYRRAGQCFHNQLMATRWVKLKPAPETRWNTNISIERRKEKEKCFFLNQQLTDSSQVPSTPNTNWSELWVLDWRLYWTHSLQHNLLPVDLNKVFAACGPRVCDMKIAVCWAKKENATTNHSPAWAHLTTRTGQ